jgi:hypothetical protein
MHLRPEPQGGLKNPESRSAEPAAKAHRPDFTWSIRPSSIRPTSQGQGQAPTPLTRTAPKPERRLQLRQPPSSGLPAGISSVHRTTRPWPYRSGMFAVGSPVNVEASGMINTFIAPVELSWKFGDSGFYAKTGLGMYVPKLRSIADSRCFGHGIVRNAIERSHAAHSRGGRAWIL